MKRSMVYRALLFTAAAIGLCQFTLAQVPDAGHKIRGDYDYVGRSARRSMQSAREYSRDYHSYSTNIPKAEKAVAQDAADNIAQYIKNAQKHMTWMRKIAAKDKEALASLDVIDKHLADALKEHHALHECCAKEKLDVALSMKCCEGIDEHLKKALAEHDKLMKRLGPATVTPPASK